MANFSISVDITTSDSKPEWIFGTISDQLEDGEWLNEYVCTLVGETHSGDFTYNVSFNIGTNYYTRPDWIIESIDRQLQDDEIILGMSICSLK